MTVDLGLVQVAVVQVAGVVAAAAVRVALMAELAAAVTTAATLAQAEAAGRLQHHRQRAGQISGRAHLSGRVTRLTSSRHQHTSAPALVTAH